MFVLWILLFCVCAFWFWVDLFELLFRDVWWCLLFVGCWFWIFCGWLFFAYGLTIVWVLVLLFTLSCLILIICVWNPVVWLLTLILFVDFVFKIVWWLFYWFIYLCLIWICFFVWCIGLAANFVLFVVFSDLGVYVVYFVCCFVWRLRLRFVCWNYGVWFIVVCFCILVFCSFG